MQRYYYKFGNMWLHCEGSSRKAVQESLLGVTDEVLTEKQAQSRADTDPELQDAIQCAAMCDLMCN
ncbi:MAG: hypothetical protein IIZ93_01225 [Acidaminococcaceae bacterium]|nr:hypothetical protein [Acidaminococcaceae bacterium]